MEGEWKAQCKEKGGQGRKMKIKREREEGRERCLQTRKEDMGKDQREMKSARSCWR